MRTIATRTLASVLVPLLTASCGTVRERRPPDTNEPIFLPRAPRTVASPVLEESELRKAITELLPYVNVEEARADLRQGGLTRSQDRVGMPGSASGTSGVPLQLEGHSGRCFRGGGGGGGGPAEAAPSSPPSPGFPHHPA